MPIVYDCDAVKRLFDLKKAKQKFYHDRHSLKDLSSLHQNDEVRMEPPTGSKRWIPTVIVKQHSEPRSYIGRSRETGDTYRRNRRHLRKSTSVANEGVALDRSFVDTDNTTSEAHDGSSCSSDKKHPVGDTAPTVDLGEPDRAVPPSVATSRPVTAYVTRTRSGRISRRPNRLDLK